MNNTLMQADKEYNAKLKEELRKYSNERRRKLVTKDEEFKLKLTTKQKLLLRKKAFENYMTMTDYILTKCNLLMADGMNLEELTPDRTIDLT